MSTDPPPRPGAHRERETPWVALVSLLGVALTFLEKLADIETLRNGWGWRALLLLFAALLLVTALLLWWRRPLGRSRRPTTVAVLALGLASFVGAWLVPQGDNNTYTARVQTRADSTQFMKWLYAHYEQQVDLRVELAQQVVSDKVDPSALTQPRRIAIRSETCGSATGGQDQLTVDACCQPDVTCTTDVILRLINPYRDDPTGVDLSWTNGSVGAWSINGTFIPSEATGAESGVFSLTLTERIPSGVAR